jgi:hypothetical protein
MPAQYMLEVNFLLCIYETDCDELYRIKVAISSIRDFKPFFRAKMLQAARKLSSVVNHKAVLSAATSHRLT